MLHVNIIKLHLNINRLHVSCKGRSYATTFSGFFVCLFFLFINHLTGFQPIYTQYSRASLNRENGSDSSTAESSATDVSVMGLGDDPYKELRLPRVKVDVTRYRTLAAQWSHVPNIGQYLQMVTSPYEWKTFEWDVKPQTNICQNYQYW